MKNTESIYLSFRGYEIIKVSMEKNKVNETDTSNNIGFMYKIIPNKEGESYDKVNIIQGAKIEASHDFPYDLEVVLKGNFEFGNDSNNSSKADLIKTNASAILFPYLRATVSLLTSQLDYEKVILPVMNFSNILEGIDISDLYLNYTEFEDF